MDHFVEHKICDFAEPENIVAPRKENELRNDFRQLENKIKKSNAPFVTIYLHGRCWTQNGMI